MPKTDKWERQHRADMARIERQVLAIYEAAAREAAAIGMTVGDLTGDLFTFDRYPITKERIERLINDMHDRLETVVVNGVNSQWTLANNKNNELCRRVFGEAMNSLTLQQQRRYFNNHDAAREAFLARKEAGLGLSDRVWRYSDLYRHEIELGLDVGLRAGTSADELTRELRSYLKYPDKLFRRVRDEHGQLVLSQAAKDFHPGQGVYRSSYMNARRLAATETNMAYRTADYDRYQDLDFVVGIEVHLSNNHNCKGVPAGAYYDICDELQGKYPKDFKFTGWHPHCRCYVTTILKTDKEIAADNERIMAGLEPSEESENEVMMVPENFAKWQRDNEERAKRHNNVPYFVKDNMQYIFPELAQAYGKLAIPIQWKDEFARVRGKVSDEDLAAIAKIAQGINHHALEKQLGIKKGNPMTIDQADGRKVNPHYGEGEEYSKNCQTCTLVYELRRRGFDIEAMGNPNREVWKIVNGASEIFKTPFGLDAEFKTMQDAFREGLYAFDHDHKTCCKNFIDAMTKEDGRYELSLTWGDGAGNATGGHVICLERRNGLLIWYDPQTGQKGDRLFHKEIDYLDRIIQYGIKLRRVDDKVVNKKMFDRLIKKH